VFNFVFALLDDTTTEFWSWKYCQIWDFLPLKGDNELMKVKFGLKEYTMGTLSHAIFGHDRWRGLGAAAPKVQNFVKFTVFSCFRPHRDSRVYEKNIWLSWNLSWKSMLQIHCHMLNLTLIGEGVGTEAHKFKFGQICSFALHGMEFCREDHKIGAVLLAKFSPDRSMGGAINLQFGMYSWLSCHFCSNSAMLQITSLYLLGLLVYLLS